MKKKWYFIIGGIIILAIFVVLALKTSNKKKIDVTVEKAPKGDITSIVTATGKVKAQADVQISADVMGRIIELPVKEGDEVKEGQLLLQIDSKSLQMDVAQTKGSLLSAQSAFENSKVTLDRIKGLFAKKLSSQSDLDQAQNAFDQAKAQVQVAEATLDRAQDQLDKSTIRSPMNGVITTLNSIKGENVVIGTMNNPGTVIMIISDLSAIEIEAQVDETDIAQVKVSQPVKITLDAFPDTTFQGKVVQVGNSAISSSGSLTADQVTNFMVKILITDIVPNIKPGMTASVDVTVAKQENAVKIPSGAVVMRTESALKEDSLTALGKIKDASAISEIAKKDEKEIEGVFMVVGSKAHFVTVKTGIRDQQNVEITSGINEGDSVITGPYRLLRTIKNQQDINPQKPKKGLEIES